ncbi:RAC-beta serine/threonine-protein kinase [Wickerhamomyces ciferrii]|uniref:RAC-beta serine/threonine-protein kinase n=1 Tax=Wickerhamomyces ciferrii (strain ATCC 14091 / BCRC 22168 / CBS 111 / JCM 3599 / NBRC 0793 / NRRL Y-1031 F-60-10) TaxID=1206466 RepID=K0KGH2_WICCF|nr:RAC-beta serine/threonine-protein kinase [Wickerhamomyces ciferrii]CCH42076.1 RAC-beta serine/threonine-protein kinase [Wickerhamomyces ciferrii]
MINSDFNSPSTPPSPSSPLSPSSPSSPYLQKDHQQHPIPPYYVQPWITDNVINLEDIIKHGNIIREPEDDNFNYVISMNINEFIEKFHVLPPQQQGFLTKSGKPIEKIIIKLQAISTMLDYYFNNNITSDFLQKTFGSPQIYVGDNLLNYHINEIESYERIEEYNYNQILNHNGTNLINIPNLLQHGIIIDSNKIIKAFFIIISDLNFINIKPSLKFKNLEKQAINQIKLLSSLGITHNNISKNNVCIDEESEKVYLIDFGNSLITDEILDCSEFCDAKKEMKLMERLFMT